MRTIPLSPHPATPCPAVHQLSVDYGWQAPGHLLLRYRLRGALAQLRLPPPGPAPTRRDELWRSTCFEAFLRREESLLNGSGAISLGRPFAEQPEDLVEYEVLGVVA